MDPARTDPSAVEIPQPETPQPETPQPGTPQPGTPQPETPTRSARRAELVAAGAVFALGLAALLGALELGYWVRGPGPGFFPLWLGALLMLLAVVWGVQGARGHGVHQPEPVQPGGTRAVALVLGALLVAILLLDVVGYQLAVAALVLFLLIVVGRRRWLESLVVALVAGFGIYALFANVLLVYLPTASVPFLAQLGL